jgi:hypothetical protein
VRRGYAKPNAAPRIAKAKTSLFSAVGLLNPLVDTSASSFEFDHLLAGNYQLVITGDVTGRNGGLFGGGYVGYGGIVAVAAAPAAPAGPAAPEPSTWAMMILGFLRVGYMAYRRRNQSAALRVA